MKFGMLVMNQYLPGESMASKLKEGIDQVAACRDAGFDLITLGQHYLAAPYQMPTSLPFLGRMTAVAGEMQVAATVILVPLHNPVEMAESVATLDALCDGRFIFGVGLGYRDEEYAAFGVQRRERVERFLEGLEVMRLLWTEEEVDFQGRFYQVPKVRPVTRPVQKPHPPIWVAANHDSAIQRAASLGYCWLINPHATMSMVREQLVAYKQALGTGVGGQDLPLMRELSIHQDRKQALDLSQPYLEGKYQAYAGWGQDKALPGEESFRVPFDDLARDRFLIGNPEDVVSEIQRYEADLGVTHMIFRMQWPGMPHAEAMRQIQLMGREVIPHFR
jgi:alkanesulfonate monooxygenase SsuD/methylene tetrahydromethanopterin reductase-like flavin-dependent oxidoreductase (luciferase family)